MRSDSFSQGLIVKHSALGKGTLTRIDEEGRIWVRFENAVRVSNPNYSNELPFFERDFEKVFILDKKSKLNIQQQKKLNPVEKICKERKISHLFHFTRLSNLVNIFKFGICPRVRLKKLKVEVPFNDPTRLDGCENASSFSISFPNYKLFYKFRTNYEEPWVLLILPSYILWTKHCAFCETNAASLDSYTICNDRMNSDALSAMFSHSYHGKEGRIIRRDQLNIPDHYTTDPQAEVMIFDTVPVKEIKYVCFEKQDILDGWLEQSKILLNRKDQTIKHIDFRVCEEYFRPRSDYSHWS
jgi:hypothetical protein